ncbi:hypothetical protein EMPG_09663 [Blastomyces silverae]|uniref:Uncharacterized protein n=1 Tax=Blastomyces silverae TaxID=2060906 RepID=A0A0H1BJF9_9EURO|nr:hypothetical protein EMPG_09663 [Blastomyces silverae]
MSTSLRRIPKNTLDLLQQVPVTHRNVFMQTAEGKNPHVQFSFQEMKIIRGTHPHPPNTDIQEVRNSITVQFNGAPGGALVAHLFNDGTIKASAEMHAENNRRRAEAEQLLAEESKFSWLQQTTTRKQAHARMMARIQAARINTSWSIMQKQLEKDSAQQEYNLFIRAQAKERIKAAQAADKK